MLSALSLQKAPKMKERITLQPDWESNHFSFVEHGSEGDVDVVALTEDSTAVKIDNIILHCSWSFSVEQSNLRYAELTDLPTSYIIDAVVNGQFLSFNNKLV